jgi:hypothetical protein
MRSRGMGLSEGLAPIYEVLRVESPDVVYPFGSD